MSETIEELKMKKQQKLKERWRMCCFCCVTQDEDKLVLTKFSDVMTEVMIIPKTKIFTNYACEDCFQRISLFERFRNRCCKAQAEVLEEINKIDHEIQMMQCTSTFYNWYKKDVENTNGDEKTTIKQEQPDRDDDDLLEEVVHHGASNNSLSTEEMNLEIFKSEPIMVGDDAASIIKFEVQEYDCNLEHGSADTSVNLSANRCLKKFGNDLQVVPIIMDHTLFEECFKYNQLKSLKKSHTGEIRHGSYKKWLAFFSDKLGTKKLCANQKTDGKRKVSIYMDCAACKARYVANVIKQKSHKNKIQHMIHEGYDVTWNVRILKPCFCGKHLNIFKNENVNTVDIF